MRFLCAAALLVLAPLAGACASASAASKSNERPDLVIPPPPPHVIPITAETVIEPVADVPSPPAANSAPANRTGRGTRETPPKPAAVEAKPEVKPDTPPVDAPVALTPTPPPAPAPQLRTVESTAADAAIRSTIERTRGLLAGVDYRQLSSGRRKTYDDSKRFVQQAEDALKEGNAAFAKGVADKAETLAKALAGG